MGVFFFALFLKSNSSPILNVGQRKPEPLPNILSLTFPTKHKR